jgi:hypothetical protein
MGWGTAECDGVSMADDMGEFGLPERTARFTPVAGQRKRFCCTAQSL